LSEIIPVETLYDAKWGDLLPLPAGLEELYGPLYMPSHPGRPHVISDYVQTMDGVVSLVPLGTPATGTYGPGGSPSKLISGASAPDLMILALLHAVADVLIVGDVGLCGNPGDVRRAETIFPQRAEDYRKLRADLGKPPALPMVVVSPHGELDPAIPALRVPGARVAVVTLESAAPRMKDQGFPAGVEVILLPGDPAGIISPRDVLDAATAFQPGELILSDAGPRFTTHLIASGRLDEFFLTVAPQIAGRDAANPRPGFAAGRLFLPQDPRTTELVSIKRAGHHLFLRYSF
jgi:riboflavin biosynthesis pyrimidine reductase